MTPAIRRASRADAAPLAEFAARTFFETYAADNDPADMAAHLAAKYSEATQAAELADPAAAYLVADLDGAIAGFAYLRAGPPPGAMVLDGPVELVRFYVAREWQGRGVAQTLMAACVDEARRLGGCTLWLSVWQRNPRAIAFYRKSGFAVMGTAVFRLGSQLQDDHVMARRLEGTAERW